MCWADNNFDLLRNLPAILKCLFLLQLIPVFLRIKVFGGFVITWGHNWVVIPPIFDFVIQISAAIIETPILFNIFESMYDKVTRITYMSMFSW